MRNRAERASMSFSSKSTRLLLRYRNRCALHNRTPSIIEAWFSSSEMIASCSVSSVSNNPPLASKQDEYEIVAYVSRKFSRCCSTCLWIC